MNEYYMRRRIDEALARLDSLEQGEPNGPALYCLLGEFNQLAADLVKVVGPDVPPFRRYESDWDNRFTPDEESWHLWLDHLRQNFTQMKATLAQATVQPDIEHLPPPISLDAEPVVSTQPA